MPRIFNLALLLLLSLLLQQQVLAGTLRDDGITSYNAGKISQAQKILEECLVKDPMDRLARFYLAHCQLSMGQSKSAAQNYTLCCAIQKPDYISIAAQQALNLIAKHQAAITAGAQSELSANAAAQDAIAKQESALAANIKNEAQNAIAEQRNLLEQQLATVDARLKGSIASLTRYIYIDGKKMEHPDYAPSVAALNEQANNDRIRMRDTFEFNQEKIEKAADKKIHDLRLTAVGMKKQMKSSRGAIGLIPEGTDLNVRNYMNFPDASESDNYARPMVPLRARPAQVLKLDPKAKPTPQNYKYPQRR